MRSDRLRVHVEEDLFGVTLQPCAHLRPPTDKPVLTEAQIAMWRAIAPGQARHAKNRRWFIAGGKRAQQLELIKKTFPSAKIVPSEGPWGCITIIKKK